MPRTDVPSVFRTLCMPRPGSLVPATILSAMFVRLDLSGGGMRVALFVAFPSVNDLNQHCGQADVSCFLGKTVCVRIRIPVIQFAD